MSVPPADPARPRLAVLYVMFEEYDFLEREIALLNTQDYLDFTFVCVSGHQSDEGRLRGLLAPAKFETVLIRRAVDNGPAGGFYDGQAWCLEHAFDAVVHVESDCFPMGPDLMRRLAEGIEHHPVVAPVCIPDGIPMGWRWCAVRREVLRSVGLSYRDLYFLTEDVYFYRNVTRRFRPEILRDVTVYHAPIIEKHAFTDRFVAAFPYLWSRNHVLFSTTLVRTHRDPRDVVNFAGYLVSLTTYALHLARRGKQRSAEAVSRGILDGLMFREDRVLKDRMESAGDDYRVREVQEFDAQRVLDKEGFDLGPGAVLSALTAVRERVLIRRTSQLVLILCYFLAGTLAITDGKRYWLLKEHPRETLADYVLFYLVASATTVLAFPLLAVSLIASRRSRATEVPPLAGAPAAGTR